MGHFGFTADTHILHFIREFGLILFVFCIGLQVGPSFFSSFKKGGMTLNLLAVGIVVLNIAVALPGEFPYLRGTKKDNNAWLVRQEIRVECPKEANAKALDILNKGVDSLSFHVKAKELMRNILKHC